MTVHFIGAGPGAPDLITLRGRDLIAACPVCLYAGSLVPRAVVSFAPEGAVVRNSASMDLDAIVGMMAEAAIEGKDVARIHSGDPSLYGAIGEQMHRLDSLGIGYEIVPGVSSVQAAAAALKTSAAWTTHTSGLFGRPWAPDRATARHEMGSRTHRRRDLRVGRAADRVVVTIRPSGRA